MNKKINWKEKVQTLKEKAADAGKRLSPVREALSSVKKALQPYCSRLYARIPQPLKKPVLLYMLLAVFCCTLAVTVTIFGQERGSSARAYSGYANGRSCVMEEAVASLYADAGLELPGSTGSSPQIYSASGTAGNGLSSGSADETAGSDTAAASDSVSTDGTDQTAAAASGASSDTAAAAEDETADSGSDVTDSLTSTHESAADRANTGRTESSSGSSSQTVTLDPDDPQYVTLLSGTVPQITHTVYSEAVTQQVIVYTVEACDGLGTALSGDSVTLTCNNTTYTPVYTTYDVMTYAIRLVSGSNEIAVTATDKSGVSTTSAATVVYNPPAESTIIISVEATTIGLGYLVSPTALAYAEGQPISYYVEQILTESGYTFTCDGTMESGFSLTSISKTDAFVDFSIPDALKTYIMNDSALAASFDELNYNADTLSQSDFTSQSGWMYCVNDTYYSYGMSELVPVADDIIRIRFTLAAGKDINGSLTETNWGDSW